MELGGANGARLTLLMLTARTRNNAEAIQVPRQRPVVVTRVRAPLRGGDAGLGRERVPPDHGRIRTHVIRKQNETQRDSK